MLSPGPVVPWASSVLLGVWSLATGSTSPPFSGCSPCAYVWVVSEGKGGGGGGGLGGGGNQGPVAPLCMFGRMPKTLPARHKTPGTRLGAETCISSKGITLRSRATHAKGFRKAKKGVRSCQDCTGKDMQRAMRKTAHENPKRQPLHTSTSLMGRRPRGRDWGRAGGVLTNDPMSPPLLRLLARSVVGPLAGRTGGGDLPPKARLVPDMGTLVSSSADEPTGCAAPGCCCSP